MGVSVAAGEAVGEGCGLDVGVIVGGGERISFTPPQLITSKASMEIPKKYVLVIARCYFTLVEGRSLETKRRVSLFSKECCSFS